MSNIQGFKINKQSGKLSGGATVNDRISALLALVAVAPAGLALGVTKKLESTRDLPALGIDAAYDTTNSEVLYHNITEFFRLNPTGVLWLRLADSATVKPGDAFDDVANTLARKLLVDAAGEVRQLAIQVNNASLAGTSLNGLPTDIHSAIAKAQSFAEWAYNTFKPTQVIIEGCNFTATPSGAGNLRAITGVKAPKVSIVIGQDGFVTTRGAAWSKRAAVGAALGMISRRKVNENIGWVEEGNLTDTAEGRFLSAYLTNGLPIENFEADLQGLEDKGYIFTFSYTGAEGIYFNGDHTCVELAHDENSISKGRSKDKAARLLRIAYLPKVKSSQPVDSATGKLPPVVVKHFDSIGENTLSTNMQQRNEISGFVVKTDPNSDLITAKKLHVAFAIVPYGEVGEIEGTLEFVKSIN